MTGRMTGRMTGTTIGGMAGVTTATSETDGAPSGLGGWTALGESWRAGDLVDALAEELRGTIPESLAEARDIVAALVGEPRFWAVLHPDAPIAAPVVEQALRAARRRVKGAPFAYAVGRAAFRYLTLAVDPRVLIPRQETELLVDLAMAALRGRPDAVVADIGTGSGAIALALATEGEFRRVIATDVSGDALDVARANASCLAPLLRAPVEFRAGHALAPLAGEVLDALIANPPYIAFEEAGELPSSVRDWEPSQALLSGSHGMELTHEIVRAGPAVVRPGGLLALEVDARRAPVVAAAAASAGWNAVTIHRDLSGRERFVLATRA